MDKRKAQAGDRSAYRRSREIYRQLAPAIGISAADVSRMWREHAEDNYEEAFKSTYPCAEEYSVYPKLLLRKTMMKWLLGSENILQTNLWKYLVKEADVHGSPKILFQTKPKDTWVLMLDDVHHVSILNPQIVIPTPVDGRNAIILSMEVYVKEREYGG